MVDLFILRHGEAGKRFSSDNKDFGRPLTVTGKKEVADIAASLKDLGIKFDLIITSPLKRAHQTAAIVAKTLKNEKKMEDWNELKPEGKRLEFYRKLSSSAQIKQQSSVLVVGHEPYLSQMIGEIITSGNGNSETANIVLKKAGLAKITVTPSSSSSSSSNSNMRGELRWLLTPKHMKNMSK